MNELDLIIKRLEKKGSEVTDIIYYDYSTVSSVDETVKWLGVDEGYAEKECWFFGNAGFNLKLSGAIVLANANKFHVMFYTEVRSYVDGSNYRVTMGIGNGLNLLGDGAYEGSKRLYGIGCNKMYWETDGCGAAVFELRMFVNGYLFVIK